MQTAKFLNLFDVDNMVEQFYTQNEEKLFMLCNKYYGNNDLALSAFEEAILPVLKTACITFINNNYNINGLTPYLFSIVISFFKQDTKLPDKKQLVYICPACKFLNKETTISFNKVFKCDLCRELSMTTLDEKEKKLTELFSIHNKKGLKCKDCERFIPFPIDNSCNIICPYYDCCFVGTTKDLKSMRHPYASVRVDTISLNSNIKNKNSNTILNLSLIDKLSFNTLSLDTEFEIKEAIKNKLLILKDVIQSQMNSVCYTSSESTLMHNLCMYESFLKFVDTHAEEMIEYLIFLRHGAGLQHKIFQEYISLLENKLPFYFRKNKKLYKITSLLDESLCIFDGISNFDAIVSSKRFIKNGTKEFYIGGRKGSYYKPYYIGKLLDITHDKRSILSDVKEYSFSKIQLINTLSDTKVTVSHLRIPPHYQMGAMVYLNRIRRKIVDEVYFIINGKKRSLK